MMLEEGLFDEFPRPDYNLMMHADATLPAGQIGYSPEYGMANAQSVKIRVNGIGGHGAYPDSTKDPVVLAAQIVLALQTIVSREISPLDPAVITVGAIHGGTKNNIISDHVDLLLTVRSYKDDVHKSLIEKIERIAIGQAKSFGLPDELLPEIIVKKHYTPAVYNAPQLTALLLPVLRKQFGDDRIIKVPPVMAAEDFSRYGRTEDKIPSHMFWLGAVDPELYQKVQKTGAKLPSLHSPLFAPLPEPTIKTGVEAMTIMVMELLSKNRKKASKM